VRGGLGLFRTLRFCGDANQTNAATRLPLVGASALAPFPPFHAFLFRGGILFEIEWAETGLGWASKWRVPRQAKIPYKIRGFGQYQKKCLTNKTDYAILVADRMKLGIG
jgi:hypothetical protein